MKLIPVGPRLAVRPIVPTTEEARRLAAVDLILPEKYADRYQPRPSTGTVVAVSEDPTTRELFSVGDLVLFALHSGTPITLEGESLLILEDRDILGKIVEEEHVDKKAN